MKDTKKQLNISLRMQTVTYDYKYSITTIISKELKQANK